MSDGLLAPLTGLLVASLEVVGVVRDWLNARLVKEGSGDRSNPYGLGPWLRLGVVSLSGDLSKPPDRVKFAPARPLWLCVRCQMAAQRVTISAGTSGCRHPRRVDPPISSSARLTAKRPRSATSGRGRFVVRGRKAIGFSAQLSGIGEVRPSLAAQSHDSGNRPPKASQETGSCRVVHVHQVAGSKWPRLRPGSLRVDAPRLLSALGSVLNAGLGNFDRSDRFGHVAWLWLREVSGIVGECHGYSIPRQDPAKHPSPTRKRIGAHAGNLLWVEPEPLIITRSGEAIGSGVWQPVRRSGLLIGGSSSDKLRPAAGSLRPP